MSENVYDIPEEFHNEVMAYKSYHNDQVRKISSMKQDVYISETELNLANQKFARTIRKAIPEISSGSFTTNFEEKTITEDPPHISLFGTGS